MLYKAYNLDTLFEVAIRDKTLVQLSTHSTYVVPLSLELHATMFENLNISQFSYLLYKESENQHE